MVDLLTNTSLELKVMKHHIKILTDWVDATTRNSEERIKNDGFRRVSLRGSFAKKYGGGIVKIYDVPVCFESRLKFEVKMILCSVRSWEAPLRERFPQA